MSSAIEPPPRRRSPLLSHPVISSVVASLVAALIIFLARAGWQAARSEELTLSVAQNPECGNSYWVPGATTGTVALPKPDEKERHWVERIGGVDVGQNEIRNQLQGTSDAEIVLDELRVVVDSRTPATVESSFSFAPPGCGGLYYPRYYAVALDEARPRAVAQSSFDQDGELVPPAPFPLRISQSDSETVVVAATATRPEVVEWHLEIPWSSKGSGEVLVIDDDGEPFRTVGVAEEQKPAGHAPVDGRWVATG